MKQARRLLKSLVTIGATMGLLLGTIGTFAPWLFPNIFTRDQKVIQEVSSYFFTSISFFHYFYQELFVLPRYQKQWRNLERFPSLLLILTFIPLHGTTCNRTQVGFCLLIILKLYFNSVRSFSLFICLFLLF